MMVHELVREARSRIAKVDNEPVRYALTAAYLWAARASEVVAVASGSDTTTPYGPRGTDVSEDLYQVPGAQPEQVAIFRIRTAKRGGMERFVALPLNPTYEPLTKPLLDYFRSRGSDYVFPFTRQTLHSYASEALAGLTYEIAPQKIDGEIVRQHERQAGVHFLRHIRASELAGRYGFSPLELATYCGWSLKAAGLTPVMMRYVVFSWQSYFHRLLLPRLE